VKIKATNFSYERSLAFIVKHFLEHSRNSDIQVGLWNKTDYKCRL